jgi:hypothetical protein
MLTATNDGVTIEQVLAIGWISCNVGSARACIGVAHKENDVLRLFNTLFEFEEAMGKGETNAQHCISIKLNFYLMTLTVHTTVSRNRRKKPREEDH